MILLNLLVIFFSIIASATEFKIIEKQVGNVKISFVRNVAAEKDQNGEEKYFRSKASFAQLEQMAPLNKLTLAKITIEDLKNLTNEEFNQLYSRLQSGPMLSGDYQGSILQKSILFLSISNKILGSNPFAGPIRSAFSAVCKENKDCVFEMLWKGKRFLAKNKFGQIEGLTLLQLPLNRITLFPMNTYCGISQIDTRKESQVVDGNFSDDFADYNAIRDEIITRKQLAITEEYRMVKPGLYIGKVYSNRVFLFNLALQQNPPTSTESENACFDGYRTR